MPKPESEMDNDEQRSFEEGKRDRKRFDAWRDAFDPDHVGDIAVLLFTWAAKHA